MEYGDSLEFGLLNYENYQNHKSFLWLLLLDDIKNLILQCFYFLTLKIKKFEVPL